MQQTQINTFLSVYYSSSWKASKAQTRSFHPNVGGNCIGEIVIFWRGLEKLLFIFTRERMAMATLMNPQNQIITCGNDDRITKIFRNGIRPNVSSASDNVIQRKFIEFKTSSLKSENSILVEA